MKKRFGREMLWMTLPIVVLGGVGFYFSRLPAPVPVDTSGAPRLVVSAWKSVAPTPLEVALGQTLKMETTVALAGRPSPSTSLPVKWFNSLSPLLQIEILRGGRWSRYVKRGEKETYLKIPWSEPENPTPETFKFRVALPFNEMPRDVEAVRLVGHLDTVVQWHAQTPLPLPLRRGMRFDRGTNSYLLSLSTPLSVVVWKRNQIWPNPNASREIPLTFVERKYEFPFSSSALHVESVVEWRGKLSDWRSKAYPCVARARVFDKQKREILNTATEFSGTSIYGNGKYGPRAAVALAELPLNRGALHLESEISVDDCWPLTVRSPVLSAWMGRRAQGVKWHKVSLDKDKQGNLQGLFLISAPKFSFESLGQVQTSHLNEWFSPSHNNNRPTTSKKRLFRWFGRVETAPGRWHVQEMNAVLNSWRDLFKVSFEIDKQTALDNRGKIAEYVLLLEGDGNFPIRFRIP